MDASVLTEGESLGSSTESPEVRPPLWKRVRALVFKNFLSISLLFFVILGIFVPEPGVFFSELPTHIICVVGLFFHSGLKLKTGEVKDAFKSFKALIWGIVCILVITTIIGGKLTGLLPYNTDHLTENGFDTNGANGTTNGTSSPIEDRPADSSSVLGPPLFQIGMQIYFIVPCTISAGVILTAQAGGAVALSVMLTVICNLSAVFTVPPLIAWIVAYENVKLDPITLLVKLVLTVLLPLLVGKALRYIPFVKSTVKKQTKTLKITSIILLTMIPWMKVSQASAKGSFSDVSVTSLFAVLGWGMAMHVLFIIIIFPPCLLLKLDKPALKSVVIMASQKSLAVAVTVSGYLPFTQAEQGMISLPLIIIHLGILVSDSVWASCWYARDAKKEKQAAKLSLSNANMLDNDSNENGVALKTSVNDQALHISSV